jgi:methyl-accepting chemotaxis protein
MTRNATSASTFIASVTDSTADIDSATREAEKHGEDVAEAGKAVTTFAEKLKTRCAVLLQQGDTSERKRERLPCHLAIEIRTAQGVIAAAVYGLSQTDVLIAGANAQSIPAHQILTAKLENIGDCRLRITEHSPAGAIAEFVNADAALNDRIEDMVWSIHDESTEFVTRAMEAGAALTKIFESAVANGSMSLDDMFDENYMQIDGTEPVQYRTKMLDWAERMLPEFQEAFLAKDSRMAFCVVIDRNGYLPVHNKIYSKPQRPGDVVWNTANSRNRRIFNDPAGLAAGRNTRSYLIQTYARDMGNGQTVMMREIDVPLRVNGRHWGGFRTAYKM